VVLAFAAACRDEAAKAPTSATSPAPTAAGTKSDAPSEAPSGGVAIDARKAILSRERAEILADPAFKCMTFQSAAVVPFVVFQEVNEQDVRDTIRQYDDRQGAMTEVPVEGTTNPAKVEQNIRWAEKADHLAERNAVLLAELDRRFRELFAGRFKLPTLEEKGRRPTVVSLWNEAHYLKATGRDRPYSSKTHLHGTLDPNSHRLLAYLGGPFLMAEDEIRCADGRVQKAGDLSLLTDAAAQLLSEYAAIHRGAPLADGAADESPPAPSWFTAGFSAWLGAFEVPLERLESPTGADVLHERIRLDFVAQARGDWELSFVADSRNSRELAEMWTLKELMKPLNAGYVTTRGDRLSPGAGDRMASFFECRAWALCHFLWNYDGGKYRERLIEYLGLYLDGRTTSQTLAVDVLKRPTADDWGDVEMEYEWYWNQLLERKVGQGRFTRTWATPTTTPPEGTVEQDAEFLAYWKERRVK
jgi:hypothetical protein